MLAIERRNAILAKLNAEGKVVVTDLSREFDVTEETIRRDLEKLDTEGLATKTYGGAVANRNLNIDLPYNVRKRSNIERKMKIAEKIAEMIHDGDYIMVDASSTAIYVTKCIAHLKNITIITNSIEVLVELSDKNDWRVLSTGGALKKGALSLVGASAERMIKGFHVDLAICSSKGLDMSMGVTDSNEKDCEIKRAIFAAANHKILAVDATKFDKISFVHVCGLDDIDTIVTDEAPSDRWVEHCRDKEVELVY